MVKEIALSKRKPGLSHDEFIKQYEEMFAPLILKHCPSIKRYIRNEIRRTLIVAPNIPELDFDCIVEVWYDDIEQLKTLGSFVASEAGKVIRDARDSFVDMNNHASFIARERISK